MVPRNLEVIGDTQAIPGDKHLSWFYGGGCKDVRSTQKLRISEKENTSDTGNRTNKCVPHRQPYLLGELKRFRSEGILDHMNEHENQDYKTPLSIQRTRTATGSQFSTSLIRATVHLIINIL